MRTLMLALIALLAGCANQAPIALKSMGSFHIGGREVTISGKPVKEVTFTPGGVPAKVDPNGVYQVEQMYVQYFIPQDQRGALPLLMWHGGGLSGVTYETTPDGREGKCIEEDARWPTIRANEIKFLEQVRAAGGKFDVVNLPQIGIKGNSHMIMMDKNSDQVADVIQQWLVKQGLYR